MKPDATLLRIFAKANQYIQEKHSISLTQDEIIEIYNNMIKGSTQAVRDKRPVRWTGLGSLWINDSNRIYQDTIKAKIAEGVPRDVAKKVAKEVMYNKVEERIKINFRQKQENGKGSISETNEGREEGT